MLSSIDLIRHAHIWDLLGQYADIRDHLEDALYSLQMLHSQLAADLDGLSDDLDDLTEELDRCSQKLVRFKTAPDPAEEDFTVRFHTEKGSPSTVDNETFPIFPEADDSGPFPWDLTEEERR